MLVHVFIYLLSLATTAVALSHGNFTNTCDRIKLVAWDALYSDCRRANTTKTVDGNPEPLPVTSFLNINDCIGGSNGTLEWSPRGGFIDYCANCTLTDLYQNLWCQCTPLGSGKAEGEWVKLDLDEGIGNNDGNLTCAWW